MYYQCKRNYTNILTNEVFNMNADSDKALPNILVSNTTGEVCKYYLIAAFDTIIFKMQDKSIITLKAGEFMPINPNNKPTHKKFAIFENKRFAKY